MDKLTQLREGLHEAWEALADGWQKMFRKASGAMTQFTLGKGAGRERSDAERHEIAIRSSGWGLLAAEVFDDDKQVVVRLEAPGLEKDDFSVQVIDNHLVVRGEKRVQREHTEGRYQISECAYGSFQRAIPLPEEVQADKAHASYRNGVLRVELPKAHPERRKRISVEVH